MNGLTEMLLVSRSGPLQARPSEYGFQLMLAINEAFQATFLSLAVVRGQFGGDPLWVTRSRNYILLVYFFGKLSQAKHVLPQHLGVTFIG